MSLCEAKKDWLSLGQRQVAGGTPGALCRGPGARELHLGLRGWRGRCRNETEVSMSSCLSQNLLL